MTPQEPTEVKFHHKSFLHDCNENPEECVDPVNVLILKWKLKHRKRTSSNTNAIIILTSKKNLWHRQKDNNQDFTLNSKTKESFAILLSTDKSLCRENAIYSRTWDCIIT